MSSSTEESEEVYSNIEKYNKKQNQTKKLAKCQELLAGKQKELQFLEKQYMKTKKETASWRTKFEYVFRENELLSIETAKVDAAHKQNSFLQQELKFKQEENNALRGLVSALEAAQAEVPRGESEISNSSSRASNSSTTGGVCAKCEKSQEAIRKLKSDISKMKRDFEGKESSLKMKQTEIKSQAKRIRELEDGLKEIQQNHLEILEKHKEKETSLMDEINGLRQLSARMSISSPGAITPPDTPPKGIPDILIEETITPDPNYVEPLAEKTVTDWEIFLDDNSLLAGIKYDEDKVNTFVDMLPFDIRDAGSKIIYDVLDYDKDELSVKDSQVVLQGISADTVEKLKGYIIPLLKNERTFRVSLSLRKRKTTVTDARLHIESREKELLPDDESNFGWDHQFFCHPSINDDDTVLHGLRHLHPNTSQIAFDSAPRPLSDDEDSERNSDSYSGSSEAEEEEEEEEEVEEEEVEAKPTKKKSMFGFGGVKNKKLGSMLNAAKGKVKQSAGKAAAASKLLRQGNWNNSKQNTVVHDDSVCEGCKVAPITGVKWSCESCEGFELCASCYSVGIHGLENSAELFNRVQDNALHKCKPLKDEFELLELLRFEICKSNLNKFKFVLNWLADVVNGKTTKELSARALEIPHIQPKIRQRFVPLLMALVSNRTNIEVKTEWELENTDLTEELQGKFAQNEQLREILRIWAADEYFSDNPFLSRQEALAAE